MESPWPHAPGTGRRVTVPRTEIRLSTDIPGGTEPWARSLTLHDRQNAIPEPGTGRCCIAVHASPMRGWGCELSPPPSLPAIIVVHLYPRQ